LKYFTKIADNVDVLPLLFQLQKHPELWDQHQERTKRPKSAHTEVSDIWLRFQKKSETDKFATGQKPHLSVWYPAIQKLPAAIPIVFWMMSRVQGEQLGGVLITKIPAGGKIDAHTDHGWHVEYYDKFYLSIKSQPGANFYCGDEVICPHPGDIWYFDNREPHWVINESNDDRITMIICIKSHG